MSGLNKAMIIGRLGADPEIRHTNSNRAVVQLRVATSERWKDKSGQQQEKTEWHSVVAWDKLAELCERYLSKGRQVFVEGKIQTRKWTAQDGTDRYKTEIVARTVQFLDGDGKDKKDGGAAPSSQRSAPPSNTRNNDTGYDGFEDDVPF